MLASIITRFRHGTDASDNGRESSKKWIHSRLMFTIQFDPETRVLCSSDNDDFVLLGVDCIWIVSLVIFRSTVFSLGLWSALLLTRHRASIRISSTNDIVQCQFFPFRFWFPKPHDSSIRVACNKRCHRLTSSTSDSQVSSSTLKYYVKRIKIPETHSRTKWIDSPNSTPCSWMTLAQSLMQSTDEWQ